MRWRVLTSVGCVLLVVVLSPPTAQAVTRAEYIAQVDPVCLQANLAANALKDRAHRVTSRLPQNPTKADFRKHDRKRGRLALQVGASIGQMLNAISAVPQPPEDAAQLEQFITTWRSAAELWTRAGRAWKAKGQKPGFALGFQAEKLEGQTLFPALRFDFSHCFLPS
jgi:hypothetical protein